MPNWDIWDEGEGRKRSCSHARDKSVGRRKLHPERKTVEDRLKQAGCVENPTGHTTWASRGWITLRHKLRRIRLSYSSGSSVLESMEALNEFGFKKN